jgi:hypothetical protein
VVELEIGGVVFSTVGAVLSADVQASTSGGSTQIRTSRDRIASALSAFSA